MVRRRLAVVIQDILLAVLEIGEMVDLTVGKKVQDIDLAAAVVVQTA